MNLLSSEFDQEPAKGGLSGHERTAAGKDEWLTPPHIIAALGEFDLDPCSPINRPWPTAKRHFTIEDNGLRKPWEGRVWMNPPYGTETDKWMQHLSTHGEGTALIFARTETQCWHKWIWPHATGVFFFAGRIYFHHVSGRAAKTPAGAPSALIAYGSKDAERLQASGLPGHFVFLR